MIITAVLIVSNLLGWSAAGALAGYIAVVRSKNRSAPEPDNEQKLKMQKEQRLRQNFLSYDGDRQ